MYYPYLRGKQFDLLALKEALSRGLLSNKIQPVIEPVRDSATLKNVIELFQKAPSNRCDPKSPSRTIQIIRSACCTVGQSKKIALSSHRS